MITNILRVTIPLFSLSSLLELFVQPVITIDEKTAVEKNSVTQMLVAGSDFKGAYDNFLEGMKSTLADYEIQSITETMLMDVFNAKLG